jgi:TRAP-type mannitol/chloroaromatic compound transport system permease small subunit
MPFVMLMLYFLVPYVMISVKSGEVSQNAGGLTIWPAKLLLLLGFVLLFFQGISEIIKKIAVMRGVIEDPTPFVSHHAAATVEGDDMASTMDLESRK